MTHTHVHGCGTRGANFFLQLFSFLIKTKVVQNVNRMTERHADRQTETDGQTDRKTNDGKTFQLSYHPLFPYLPG